MIIVHRNVLDPRDKQCLSNKTLCYLFNTIYQLPLGQSDQIGVTHNFIHENIDKKRGKNCIKQTVLKESDHYIFY